MFRRYSVRTTCSSGLYDGTCFGVILILVLFSGPGLTTTRAGTYQQDVQIIIDSVDATTLSDVVSGLSGASSVVVGGEPYLITTRHTASGEPITKAVQYVYEQLLGMGLTVSYQPWSGGGYLGQNVIAEKTGLVSPDQVILVSAHLDDLPTGPVAPGADANASGCAAVLELARAMACQGFEKTIRFVLYTGLNQGSYGSDAYAMMMFNGGENIVAVLNAALIAYDSDSNPIIEIHTRSVAHPQYAMDQAIALVFSDVAAVYWGLDGVEGNPNRVLLESVISPQLNADGLTYGDQASFWDYGYAGILYMEDLADFSPYFNTIGDLITHLNMLYFTNGAKLLSGTVALLAQPEPVLISVRVYADDTDGDGLDDVRIEWTPLPGASAYNVHFGILPGQPLVLLAGPVDPPVCHENALTDGCPYYYKVEALP